MAIQKSDELGAGPSALSTDEAKKIEEGMTTSFMKDKTSSRTTIGFGTGLNLMQADNGDVQINKIVEVLAEKYKDRSVKVGKIDKSYYRNIAHSSVLVYAVNGSTIYYFVLLVAATGEEPQTASQIVDEVAASQRGGGYGTQFQNGVSRGGSVNVFIPSDTLDVHYEKVIEEFFSATVQGSSMFDIISTDGVVIPADVEIDVARINEVGTLAYNCIDTQIEIETGRATDISIENAVSQINNGSLSFNIQTTQTGIKDIVGNVKRSDFRMMLCVTTSDRRATLTPNDRSGAIDITKVSGYVDAIPYSYEAQKGKVVTGMSPLIVLNYIDPTIGYPTIGYTLMAIISGRLMAQDNMWPGVMLPSSRDEMHMVGALNRITNCDDNQNGGESIDLFDKSFSSDDVQLLIREIFSQDPIYAIDIEEFGPNYYTQSVFKDAGDTDKIIRRDAVKEINKVAKWLTNGLFETDESPFSHYGFNLPTGYWFDKDGNKRDISEVDITFISNHPKGTYDMIRRYVATLLPYEKTGVDPFIERCAILSEIIGTAVITGKVTRLIFSPDYIDNLSEAAQSCGFNVSYNQIVKQNYNMFEQTTSYLSRAGFSGNSSFALQRDNNSRGFRMGSVDPLRRRHRE